jgi:hypothetical protein
MKPVKMKIRIPLMRCRNRKLSVVLAAAALSLILSPAALTTFAQQRFSKTYPARKKISIHLSNWSGPITVEGWQKDQIKITADMEAPTARITPQVNGDALEIDVARDNQGRGDVGSVNFKIFVPYDSSVDIETRIGDLSVNNVQGSMVRAHVSSEGNISLTQIRSPLVMAGNVTGDILFDGELLSDGVYSLQTTGGNINIRIPEDSAFRLVASAPMTQDITLGPFATSGLNFISGRRKVVGNVGNGKASLSVTNQRGSISFIRR